MPKVHVLDYISGNVRSLHNAIEKLGWEVEYIKDPSEIDLAEVRTVASIPEFLNTS